MSHLTRLLVLSTALALPMTAQEPRIGLAFNVDIPTGGLRSTTYGPTQEVKQPQVEGFDPGVGGQFTISFPLDMRSALRLNLSGHTLRGTNVAKDYPTLNVEHSLFSLGAEMQFFTGNAFRHRGAYLLAGVSADFESWGRGYNDNAYEQMDVQDRKTRMGATFGVGRTFGYDGGLRLTLEAAYHKTLTGADANRNELPAADFLKLSLGCVF